MDDLTARLQAENETLRVKLAKAEARVATLSGMVRLSLNDAVMPGPLYRHTVSDAEYEVVGLSRDEETLAIRIHYRKPGSTEIPWSRVEGVFDSMISDGRPRFEYLGAAPKPAHPGISMVPALHGGAVRPETGPMQFGDADWPGVFIRGDNALWFAMVLRLAIAKLPAGPDVVSVINRRGLEGLAELLHSCAVE